MGNRDFSDSVKLEVIKRNLEKNEGNIFCEICKKKITSIAECHFDHIFPYSKGGKSTEANCQILCVECNLKKNDKYLQDFILEEKARRFLSGENVDDESCVTESETPDVKVKEVKGMTKEIFDRLIKDFLDKSGDIHKVDFGREYNNLPSIHYVKVYYGDLNSLKKAFGIIDLSMNWDRDTIKTTLLKFISINGSLKQEDMKKSKGLPSVPCVLTHFPECKNFTDIKKIICGIEVREQWNIESAIEAGKSFLEHNERITQKSLLSENGMPSLKVIESLFGSLAGYQAALGTAISKRNEYISKDEIRKMIDDYFDGRERMIESQKVFFDIFPFSHSTIYKRYGTFENLCKEEKINLLNYKKAKYTKREVDDAISNWIKNGNPIPKHKDLVKVGLPSSAVILRFYKDWKEPFILYQKLHDEVKRVNG